MSEISFLRLWGLNRWNWHVNFVDFWRGRLDPCIPRISILGVGRTKFRETDSKVVVGPARGRLSQTTPYMRHNETFQERANTGALKARVKAQFTAFKETTLASSLRRRRCAIPYRAKARPGTAKNLDRAAATQEMQEQDAVDDPPAECDTIVMTCTVDWGTSMASTTNLKSSGRRNRAIVIT